MDRLEQLYAAMSSQEKEAFGEELQKIPFEIAQTLLSRGRILSFRIDPQKQTRIKSGNTVVTLIGPEGQEYEVVAQYDHATNQIYPPL